MSSGGRNNPSKPDKDPDDGGTGKPDKAPDDGGTGKPDKDPDNGGPGAPWAVGAGLLLGAAAWGISKWLGSSDPEPPHKGKNMVALGTSAETGWQTVMQGKMEASRTTERSYQQPPTKTTDIRHHEFYDTHNTYYVFFHGDSIHTTVTRDPAIVSKWISDMESINRHCLHNLIVGLDAEWRPSTMRGENNPVATLQLCVGQRCLIFQLIHCPNIPSSLRNFLADPRYTFVGVKIKDDLEKLQDYRFGFNTKAVDLRVWAAQIYGDDLKEEVGHNPGLNSLAKVVLGKEMEKGTRVSWSDWDNESLTPEQVMYACLDAFVGYEIGRKLNASSAPY